MGRLDSSLRVEMKEEDVMRKEEGQAKVYSQKSSQYPQAQFPAP